jgi:hypothetical protein
MGIELKNVDQVDVVGLMLVSSLKFFAISETPQYRYLE